MNKHQQGTSDIEAQAAWWVVRMGAEDFTEAERSRLDDWRRSDPEHETAFRFALGAWKDLGSACVSTPDKDSARTARRPAQTAPVRSISNKPAARNDRNRKRSMVRLGVATAAVLLLVALLPGLQAANPLSWIRADHHTGYGEIRTVALPDGSSIRLNTRTALTLHFSDTERRVELLEGEAVFTVVPDPNQRPFIVEAGLNEVRALGTRFVVLRKKGLLHVTALHHSVEISAGETVSKPVRRVLEPGQEVRYDKNRGLGPIQPFDRRKAAAWERGRLVFDRVPLSEMVEEINRYRVERIVVANEDLARRRVSAVFHLDNLDQVVGMAADELKADVAHIPPYYTVLY